MISIVLVHIGNQWPSHMLYCVNQIRKFFDGDLYIISNLESPIPDNPSDITYVNCHELLCDRIEEFRSINFLKDYGLDNFWSHAFERLLLIEALLVTYRLERVVHIENDVLIYHDPSTLPFKDYFSNRVAFNPLGQNFSTASYVYIDNPKAMGMVNGLLINHIKNGKDKLLQMFPNESMVNEMMLLSILQRSKSIDYFPINVEGVYSDNYGNFNMIFDPASWGQYIGGTPGGHNSGILFDHHWIGHGMKDKNFEIKWVVDGKGRRKPLLSYNNNEYPFATLHIHSKKLLEYC